MYLLQGNRDECAVTFESYMTAFLPHGHEAEVVAKNLDEILSMDWSQTRQRSDQESALWGKAHYLLSRLFFENRQVQIKRFFKVPLGLSQRLAHGIYAQR